MLCDPVLAFIKAFQLQGSVDSLKRAALAKFDDGLMSKAKKDLWESPVSSGDLESVGLSYQTRRGSERRTQAAADLDDILCAFDKLDEANKVPEIFCEAAQLVNLPPVAPDPVTELVKHNNSTLQDIHANLESLRQEISTVSDKLAHVSSGGGSSSPLSPARSCQGGTTRIIGSSSSSNNRFRSDSEDRFKRHENLVVFGIQESPSLSGSMDSVQKMLQFITGRQRPVKDLFRIGKFKKPEACEAQVVQRPRPIVVKLASPWDRRLVLANKFKLKDYDVPGVFVREDLSPDERQKRKEKFALRGRSSPVQS